MRLRTPLRAMVLGLLGSLLVALAPADRAAAVSIIPDEPGSLLLDERPSGALVADVDGDGVRELVTLVRAQDDPVHLAVEVWRAGPDGWASEGQVGLRRGVGAEEILARHGLLDPRGMLPLLANDPARLVAWHSGNAERVLVIVNSSQPIANAPPCCVTVWELVDGEPSVPGISPGLQLLSDAQRAGSDVIAIDMDGDGTEELLIAEPADPDHPGLVPIDLLRWDAAQSTFRVSAEVRVPTTSGELVGALRRLGDSDGQPGDEAILLVDQGFGYFRLTRISFAAGVLRQELAVLPRSGPVMLVPTDDGPRILVGLGDRPAELLAWPAGTEAAPKAVAFRFDIQLGVVGSGPGARVLLTRNPGLALQAATPSMVLTPGVSAAPAAAKFFSTPQGPYAGAIPGGLPGGDAAFIFAGQLIRADPTGAQGHPGFGLVVTPMAALPGSAPLGTLGPGGGWIALVHADTTVGPEAVDRGGGPLAPPSWTAISLARTSQVLEPEADAGLMEARVTGAVREPDTGTVPGVVTRGPTFTAQVGAPPGSMVRVSGGEWGEMTTVGDGEPVKPGPDGRFAIKITGSVPDSGDQRYVARLTVITPAGHGYLAAWRVHVVRGAPSISVGSSFASLGLSATVTGRTDPDAQLTVDGRPATVQQDGTFQVAVSAGLIPRDVVVTVTNVFGNVSTRLVSVVGPVDYRRLPWIPITALLTLVAGAFLFIRSPSPGGVPRSVDAGEGSFEELDEHGGSPR